MPKIYTKEGQYVCEKCKDDTFEETKADETTPHACDNCGALLINK